MSSWCTESSVSLTCLDTPETDHKQSQNCSSTWCFWIYPYSYSWVQLGGIFSNFPTFTIFYFTRFSGETNNHNRQFQIISSSNLWNSFNLERITIFLKFPILAFYFHKKQRTEPWHPLVTNERWISTQKCTTIEKRHYFIMWI